MLVAMTYMLGCSSRGIATTPMEGMNASGIRKVLKIPRRYAIPMIVGTGLAYKDDKDSRLEKTATRRYPMEEVIFGDSFGEQMTLSPQS
jgi:nitroreductase